MANVMDTLRRRGFFRQANFEDDLCKRLGEGPVVFYNGFDPTADSLHVGHYIPVMAMAHMQRAGHKPIVLIGGGTAMVGDPSGKTELRKIMTEEVIAENAKALQKQFARFLDFDPAHENCAIMVNNADWLMQLNYVHFLREIGALFSVNRMLTAECYKQRLERGHTFLEFNYMLMQSYDFLELFRRHGCTLQTGGDDQWSNILAGADLIRRKEGKEAFALTFQLLLTSDGRKMGKTEKGSVWLDPARTSPYEFYQYWRNVDDADVKNCLSLLTFLPMEEVERLAALKDAGINQAKAALAFEVTKQIHGAEEAEKARAAAEALFSGGAMGGSVPTTSITPEELEAEGRLCALLARCGLCASNGEARKKILEGGIYLNDERVSDINARVTADMLSGEGILLRKGKKNFHRLVLGA